MANTVGYPKKGKIRANMSKDMKDKFNAARDRLEFGRRYRMNHREGVWAEIEQQYMNETQWDRRDDPTADVVNINVSFSTVATLVPFISDENPRFKVEAYSGDASPETARLLQSWLNRMWQSDDVDGQTHVADSVWDYASYGDGFMMAGFDIERVPQRDSGGDIIKNESGEVVGQDVARFFVERLSPWDVWVDPFSDGLHNARWVCRRVILPVKEVLESDHFKVLDKEAIQGGFVDINNPDMHFRVSEINAPDDRGLVEIYEFYDIEGRWSMSWTNGDHSAPIRYVEDVTSPIVQFPNYRIPNSPYHMGELENIRALQEELNKTRSQMITHRRRNVMKWIVQEDEIDDEARAAIRSSRINDIIGLRTNRPFDQIITPVEPQQLGEDTYMIDGIIRNDINEITGVNEYLRGVPQDVSRTATEASIIEGGANIRTRHKLMQIERGLRKLAQLLLDIASDVIPQTDFEELKIYITGSEADSINRAMGEQTDSDVLFTPTPESFEGKYVVFVERNSVELRNPQVAEQRFKEMFQLLLGAVPILMQTGMVQAMPNIRRVMELWFEAAGIADVDLMFADSEEAGQALQFQQLQQAMLGGDQQGAPSENRRALTAGNTAPGNARPEAAQAPDQQINSTNSGTLPPQNGRALRV